MCQSLWSFLNACAKKEYWIDRCHIQEIWRLWSYILKISDEFTLILQSIMIKQERYRIFVLYRSCF